MYPLQNPVCLLTILSMYEGATMNNFNHNHNHNNNYNYNINGQPANNPNGIFNNETSNNSFVNRVAQGDYAFASYISKTYLWMFIGLAVTFGLSFYLTLNSHSVESFILNNYGMYLTATVISFVSVIVVGFCFRFFPPTVAKIVFIIYSADLGIILTPVLLAYEFGSVMIIFGVTSAIYLTLAIIGLTTKKDTTKLGFILSISLIAILIYSLISFFFFRSTLNQIIIDVLVLAVFMGFTVYDNSKLKRMYYSTNRDERSLAKSSIYGALQMYLDYINIFIRLLSLFGKRRN